MESLYEKLEEYSASDYYGFHMPGHKRNTNYFGNGLPYHIDITEIDGFDDLHHAEAILQKAEERAARLYHSEETHFLVNGSTVGILSAILGVTKRGDKIIVARNCHKSVYNAIFLNGLNPVYVYPEYEKNLQINGEVSFEDLKNILEEHPDAKAVMIVSPTYDGVVSDIGRIAELVHAKGIPLIVDEAHGAHFGFHPFFPENSIRKGADLVIHSVHKTLPALTQTALIHINGTLVNRDSVRNYLHMLQSSSPSYVLMASIDRCMEMLDEQREQLFAPYVERLKKLRAELAQLKHLEIIRTEHFDPSKIIISTRKANITSQELTERLLRDYYLQMEMTAGTYVLAMTTIGDEAEGFERLREALLELDARLEATLSMEEKLPGKLPRLEFVYSNGEIEDRKRENEEWVRWNQAIGKVSTEYAYVYPPGIPLIVPGELISEEAVNVLQLYDELGFSIEGIHVENYIGVLKNG